MDLTQKELALLEDCILFQGVEQAALVSLLACLKPTLVWFERGEEVFPGESSECYGILLSGGLCAERFDINGNRSVAGAVRPGQIFGEILALGNGRHSAITVRATERSKGLLFDFSRTVAVCQKGCAAHRTLLSNLFSAIGTQYFALADRVYYLSRRTLRDKLCAYLTDCAAAAGGDRFTVPFSREELADYLCADRSALCRELSRMRQENLLDVWGKHFRWLKQPEQ